MTENTSSYWFSLTGDTLTSNYKTYKKMTEWFYVVRNKHNLITVKKAPENQIQGANIVR